MRSSALGITATLTCVLLTLGACGSPAPVGEDQPSIKPPGSTTVPQDGVDGWTCGEPTKDGYVGCSRMSGD